MNSFEKYRLPHVVFGLNTAAQAGEKLKAMGGTKCLVVTDSGVIRAGLVAPILESLDKAGLPYVIYDGVLPNPPDYTCLEAAEKLKSEHCDCTLAIGGGSSIDTAKAANLIADLPGEIGSLHDYGGTGTKMKPSYGRTAKFVAIPTTAGTGAEVTVSAVIYDPKLNLKYSFMNENMVADCVIIDPMLTVGMPPRPTAVCGLDALCHALEVVVGARQNDFSALLAFDCVERIWKWLPVAFREPGNLEARSQMAYAANMAESAGGAANGHCVGHAIGARYNIVHGHSCIMVMPTLIRHHAEVSADNIRRLADIMGVPSVGSAQEVAWYVADAVLRYYKSFGLDTCRDAIRKNGFEDDEETFVQNLIPAILDDYKSRVWMPPIHRSEDRERLEAVCRSIYEEE